MALPLEDRKRQEEAAKQALAEFEKNWEKWNARDVAEWWNRWCQSGSATHDWLGKILMHTAGVRRYQDVDFLKPGPSGISMADALEDDF